MASRTTQNPIEPGVNPDSGRPAAQRFGAAAPMRAPWWRWGLVLALGAALLGPSAVHAQVGECLSCHDKPKFTRANSHTVPAKGCDACHVSHQAKKTDKLLVEETPDLCYSCHQEKAFKGKVRHDPVAQGACLDCHDAHSAEHPAMLNNAPVDVCLDCHASDLKGKPHVIAAFSRNGHPLGNEAGAGVADPLRPNWKFYCGSCHDPHRSDHPRLNRFDPGSMTGYCQRCHQK